MARTDAAGGDPPEAIYACAWTVRGGRTVLAPARMVQVLVRCRSCRHYVTARGEPYCRLLDVEIYDPYGFCSWAEAAETGGGRG